MVGGVARNQSAGLWARGGGSDVRAAGAEGRGGEGRVCVHRGVEDPGGRVGMEGG